MLGGGEMNKKSWYHDLITMAYSGMFIWENLPNGITQEQLEYQLFRKSNTAIVKYNDNWYAEGYSIMEQVDIYQNPIKIKVQMKRSDFSFSAIMDSRFSWNNTILILSLWNIFLGW